jgi:hypothetical protein
VNDRPCIRANNHIKRDYLYIGATPCDEHCVSTGVTRDVCRLNLLECSAYIMALRRRYGPEPEGASLRPRTEDHDAGLYAEVVCWYDVSCEVATRYAYEVESGLMAWADVGMQAPVVYDDHGQPVTIRENEAEWILPDHVAQA